MILLVPVSPEVPKPHLPRLWQGLVFVLVLALCHMYFDPVLERDRQYMDGLQQLTRGSQRRGAAITGDPEQYIALRPLLTVAPAHADWDFPRLAMANFIHGGKIHLALNLIGAFAGARICATFLSFVWIFLIFLAGGTLGLWASVLLPTDVARYVPHVGASAGIFALMGTYYVYNFRYRTRYFFWFPAKHGLIALPTSWFFFIDVLLLELVLSLGQLFPTPLDGVDHAAHVVGFLAGAALAFLLKMAQRRPNFIQTRAELVYWKSLRVPEGTDPHHAAFHTWIRCLEINPYNDRIKDRLFQLLERNGSKFGDEHVEAAFRFISPALSRRASDRVGQFVKTMMLQGKKIPRSWLQKTPYDVVIRVAKYLAADPNDQKLLYVLLQSYRGALPEGVALSPKIELLMARLGGILPEAASADSPGSANEGSSPRSETPRSSPRKATGGHRSNP